MARDKKIWIRLALFILAAAVAVGSFTHGVLSLVHRESGWYEIEPDAATRAVSYDSGIRLLYYSEGGSSAIRQETSAVQKAFSVSLLRYDKLLDAKNEFENSVNIASIIAADGEPVFIDEALYEVLADALAKTARKQGYSVFAGALWREWETLLYLDEPQLYDPANDAHEAARVAALADAVGHEDWFSLMLADDDGFAAAFTVSREYRDFEAAYELDAPALDLNALREAYLMRLVARDMAAQGFTRGYLYTEDGLTALLDADTYRFDLLGFTDGAPVRVAALPVDGPAAFCQFTAFRPGEGQYGWYAVETEAGTLLRHPRFDARTGGFHNVLLSVALASGERDIVDLAYEAVELFAMDSRAAVQARLAQDAGTDAAWIWRDDGAKTLFTTGALQNAGPDEAGGWSVALVHPGE
ncbi:MAG: hypothetical protein IKS52_08225 [Clostridia bacterium]|nr:hypothetical protein [Clostridia bacterium]